MGKHLVWVVVFLVVAVCGGEVRGGEPVGDVYRVRVETWGSVHDGGGHDVTQAALMVPRDLDSQGTFTVVMNASQFAGLMALDRDDLPESLHFLFGKSGRIYVRVYRPMGGITASGPRELITVEIPFDRDQNAEKERRIRIVDAAGRGVQGVDLEAGFLRRFGGPDHDLVDFEVGDDGAVTLPRVIDRYKDNNPTLQPSHAPNAYHLSMTDSRGQNFTALLKEHGDTSETLVMLPVVNEGPVPDGVTVVEGRLVDGDGEVVSDCRVTLSLSHHYRMQSDLNRRTDPTTVTVTSSGPVSDGTVRFAVSGDHGIAPGKNVPIYITEGAEKTLVSTRASLKPGEMNVVDLPKRLTLTAELLDRDGKPYLLMENSSSSHSVSGMRITRLSEEEQGEAAWLSPKADETTGALFQINKLAVPGRYFVEFDDAEFGPVEIGVTSPTKVVTFRRSAEDGRLHGRVLTEAGEALEQALVVMADERPSSNWEGWKTLGEAAEKLTVGDEDGMDKVLGEMDAVMDFRVTTGSGEYAFLRRDLHQAEVPKLMYVIVVARNRFPAYIVESRWPENHPLALDAEVLEVRLPGKVMVRGRVSGPDRISDVDHPGDQVPMPPGEHRYNVYLSSTIAWFGGQYGQAGGWQYYSPQESFVLGEAFEYEGPAGTSFTLGARAEKLPLSLQLWREAPASVGDVVEVDAATLRALEPFKLRLVFRDGSAASGLGVSSLYNGSSTRLVDGKLVTDGTDDRGEMIMWGDEGLAPQIRVSENTGSFRHETFPIQKLDTSTPVPVLEYTLDPTIWGVTGGGVR